MGGTLQANLLETTAQDLISCTFAIFWIGDCDFSSCDPLRETPKTLDSHRQVDWCWAWPSRFSSVRGTEDPRPSPTSACSWGGGEEGPAPSAAAEVVGRWWWRWWGGGPAPASSASSAAGRGMPWGKGGRSGGFQTQGEFQHLEATPRAGISKHLAQVPAWRRPAPGAAAAHLSRSASRSSASESWNKPS